MPCNTPRRDDPPTRLALNPPPPAIPQGEKHGGAESCILLHFVASGAADPIRNWQIRRHLPIFIFMRVPDTAREPMRAPLTERAR